MCGSVILQHDKSVKNSADIRRLLERWITLWQQHNFDLLLLKVERCNKTFQQTRNRVPNQDAVVQVFSWLVLQGKLKAAICWATERARGIVLSPCDRVSGCTDGSTVLDVLHQKHLDPNTPVKATLEAVMPIIGKMFCYVMVFIALVSGMLLLSLSQVGKHNSAMESGIHTGVKSFDCLG